MIQKLSSEWLWTAANHQCQQTAGAFHFLCMINSKIRNIEERQTSKLKQLIPRCFLRLMNGMQHASSCLWGWDEHFHRMFEKESRQKTASKKWTRHRKKNWENKQRISLFLNWWCGQGQKERKKWPNCHVEEETERTCLVFLATASQACLKKHVSRLFNYVH